jgi:hypothetical protein
MTYRASAKTTTWQTLVILDKRGKTVRADRGKSTKNSPFTLLRGATILTRRAPRTNSMAWPLDEKWDLSH